MLALDHVLKRLERLDLHHVAGRLGFEDHFFLCEGIDPRAGLGGRFADDFDLGQTWDREDSWSALLDVLANQSREIFHQARDFFLGKTA